MKFGKKERLPENLELKKILEKKVLITGNLGFKGSWFVFNLAFLKQSFWNR